MSVEQFAVINGMLAGAWDTLVSKEIKRALIIKNSLGIAVASKYLKCRGYSVELAVTILCKA